MEYTERDGEELFDWDAANEEHVSLHGVTPREAEQVLLDPSRRRLARANFGGEYRYTVIARTMEGRLLVVVYTIRRDKVRVVTARVASANEARRFRRRA